MSKIDLIKKIDNELDTVSSKTIKAYLLDVKGFSVLNKTLTDFMFGLSTELNSDDTYKYWFGISKLGKI